MHCPSLKQLPAPPKGKTGWPWTEEISLLESPEQSDFQWPRISIITPSYNQGEYIEATLRSVLLQGYPDIEYIIMDGGSNDGILNILEKYKNFFTHLSIKKDNGQSDAIKKGFSIASGNYIAWINSDDMYLKNCLFKVIQQFLQNPEKEWLIGNGIFIDSKDKFLLKCKTPLVNNNSLIIFGITFLQPSVFFSRTLYNRVGGIDTRLSFCFDYDLFIRFIREGNPSIVDYYLSAFRLHSKAKTSTLKTLNFEEHKLVQERYLQFLIIPRFLSGIYYFDYGVYLLIFRMFTSGISRYFIFKLNILKRI